MQAAPSVPGLEHIAGLHAGLLDLARAAGQAILLIYEAARSHGPAATSTRLEDKSDGSPLTQADLAAHHIICQGLAALTPQIAVVSEEDQAGQHQARSGMFWLIDPLDGTKEFLAFNGEFTVNIALIQDGAPRFGVVYAPALDTLYWGGRAAGAFSQGPIGMRTLQVAAARGAQEAVRVVASKSHLNDATRAFIARFVHTEVVQAGSSLKFCRLAEAAADVYPRLGPTCEWDTAAAQAVLEGAGGYVFDTEGQPLRYGKADVLNPCFIAASRPFSTLPQA